MAEWISNEIGNTKLKDKRLSKRLSKLLEVLTENPSSSIPEACESLAGTKAAYRFFDNDRIEAKEIQTGFIKSTVERIKRHELVLIDNDSTGFNFSSHKSLKGAGVLRNFQARGLIMHSCLAITPEAEPLGLLYQNIWGRKPEDYGKRNQRAKLPIEKKESYVWIESLQQVQKLLPASTKGIIICDRGSDIFDVFAQPLNNNCELLIRAAHNRHLENDSERLFEKLSNVPRIGTMEVAIARSNGNKKRIASLEIHVTSVSLQVPASRKKENLKPIKITAIMAKETNPPSDINNPIDWKLLTTMSVQSSEDAEQCIQWYAKRWLIERYHYALKSGCNIEKLQLEDASRMERAISVYSIVAWRLMRLTYLARTNPDASCDQELEKEEWEALCCFVHKIKNPPKDPPTIKQAIDMIAKLGGFLGRKHDGHPGIKVIWRGLRRLEDITETYRILGKRCG